jgi:hypothetical protein
MQKKLSSLFDGHQLLTLLLILGCIEFGFAAVLSLGIKADSKNAFLFGYSSSRLALAGLSLSMAAWFLFLTRSAAFRTRVMQKLEAVVQKAPLAFGLGVALLAGLAVLLGLTPSEALGNWGFYFVRARLFLFVFCLYPAQFSLYWLQGRRWNSTLIVGRPFLVSLFILVGLGGFIILSGWGITPDYEYWYPGGNPLTNLQLAICIWVGMLTFGLFWLVKEKLPAKSGNNFDLLIVLCLFAGAIYFWMQPPSPHSEFSIRPDAPYFQSYPGSDGAVHDLGALSILQGSRIFFGQYTDKPLYMVFLAFLHLMGGYDYNFLAFLHAGFMALMAPGLYFFGKSFHSRLFGFILAGIVVIRQYNAIYLSASLYWNATARQFQTEVPTLLGLIFFTWAFFLWVKAQDKGNWLAFMTGGILGAVTLVRLNPFLLVLTGPIFLYFSRSKQKRVWLQQSLMFLLGCVIMILPWVVTGTNSAGTPYFLIKFQDVLNVRYGPIGALPTENVIHSATSGVSSEFADELTPLHAGFDIPPISIHTFPGFVINHTLHNFVGAFLTLPDSIQVADQNLDLLVNRPSWSAGLELVAPAQIPFILLNLIWLALGLSWAWKRWRWAGLTPIFVFVVYSLSLGFGRTSNSRYIVPIDWVVNFYFVLGLLRLFQLVPEAFRCMLEAEPVEVFGKKITSVQTNKWIQLGGVTLVICLAILVPAVQKLIPPQAPICQSGNKDSMVPVLVEQGAPKQFDLVYGEILYPAIKKDHLSFVLLTCDQYFSFEVNGFYGKLAGGQQVLAGLSDKGSEPNLMFIALSPAEGEYPKIIWPGH